MRLKSWGTLETFSRLVKIHNFKSTGVSWIWRREEAAQLMKKRGGGGGQKLNGPTKQQLVDLSGFCKPPGGNELMFRHTQTLCIYTWNREKKASKSVVLELFWGIFDLIARGTDACICGEWKTSSSAVSCSGQAENSHLLFVENDKAFNRKPNSISAAKPVFVYLLYQNIVEREKFVHRKDWNS